jgi:hypothetical protein
MGSLLLNVQRRGSESVEGFNSIMEFPVSGRGVKTFSISVGGLQKFSEPLTSLGIWRHGKVFSAAFLRLSVPFQGSVLTGQRAPGQDQA